MDKCKRVKFNLKRGEELFMTKQNKWEEVSKEIYNEYCGIINKLQAEHIVHIVEKFIKQTLKAQQCNKCYGKGYRTELKGRRELPKKFSDPNGAYTYSEHSGKQIGSFIKKEFCDCNIGKALQQQEEDFKKVLRDIEKIISSKFNGKVSKEIVDYHKEIISIIKKNKIDI